MNAQTTTATPTAAPIHFDDRPDDEIAAMLQQMIDACPSELEPGREPTDVERASARVCQSAKRFQNLINRAAGGESLYRELWSAKKELSKD